ncbi:Notchless protein [Ceratobasidium sp. AG-Ba]|nr:Notchless protein [Ceratobasidium sp. AG-Ba]
MVNEQLANSRLEAMQPVKQGRYDSSAATMVRRRACTPNTRIALLEELQAWANNPNGPKVYWMNGMAGTGKTTIAYTFCRMLEKTHQLAASFFCSRELPDCRDSTRIVPTLAYQLARFSPPFHAALCRMLSEDPDFGTREVPIQFEKLLAEPLLDIKDTLPPNLIVAVDALDECTRHNFTISFLSILLSHAPALPVRFFVTCRPEPILYNQIQSQDTSSRTLFHLHNIESTIVQADIETFLAAELGDLSVNQIKSLVRLSDKLFIFAATVVRYVKPSSTVTLFPGRLETILSAAWEPGSKAYRSIDFLYDKILAAALENDEFEPRDVQAIINLLHTVVCAKEPLNIIGLAGLLDIDVDLAKHAAESLQSVLHISEQDGLISALHASFPDYLLNAKRSGQFFCNSKQKSEALAVCCFGSMDRLLRLNICDLESSYFRDEDVEDISQRIADNIPPNLLYACKYWMVHLSETTESSSMMGKLQKFLEHQVLFWLEVVNLTDRTYKVVSRLFALKKWLLAVPCPSDIRAFLQDVCAFTAIVVLGLWDRSKPMWNYYGVRTRGLVQKKRAIIEDDALGTLAVWGIASSTTSVALSPDGAHLVHVNDSTVCILDTNTGRESILFSQTDHPFTHAAFSPDGHTVALRLKYGTICILDTQSGILQGGSEESDSDPGVFRSSFSIGANPIAFSPDGSHVVSIGDYGMIRTWAVASLSIPSLSICGPKRHEFRFRCVSLSPTGKWLAFQAENGNVNIYDTATGKAAFGSFNYNDPGYLRRATSITFSLDEELVAIASISSAIILIWEVAFSPDTQALASSSIDRTIYIWDTHNGDLLCGPLVGHTGNVNFLMFMPDGSRLISGSWDKTVRVWDLQASRSNKERTFLETHCDVSLIGFSENRHYLASLGAGINLWDSKTGDAVIHPLRAAGSNLEWAAFLPDGNRLISSRGREIHTWGVKTGTLLNTQYLDPEPTPGLLSLSPNGQCLATYSSDRIVRIWDARTVKMLRVLPADRAPIFLTFTIDGGRLFCGYSDCTACIWDVYLGRTLTSGPVQGPTNKTEHMACSPDGKCVVSASEEGGFLIWDAYTGSILANPPPEYKSRICSLLFSHDGRRIISASYDSEIWLWDAQTGDMLAGPFKAHVDEITSMVLSSDGSILASSDKGGRIFIWNFRSDSWYVGDGINGWSIRDDGWIVGSNSERLLWVMPHLRFWLNQSRTYVVHDRGPLGLKMDADMIGERWKGLRIG